MANGNGWILKTVIGIPVGMMITAMGFMGNGIVENDRRNVDAHTGIRITFEKKVDTINDNIGDIRVEQMRQSTILEKIDRKLYLNRLPRQMGVLPANSAGLDWDWLSQNNWQNFSAASLL